MKWEKLGLVIRPQGFWWMESYAMVPTVDQIEGSLYRVYFSGRDAKNRSHVGFAIMDLDRPDRVVAYGPEPVLAPGELGTFDDNGVTPSSIVNHNGQRYLFYIGWKPRSTVRMSLIAGLAVSTDGGKSFRRFSRAPLMPLTDDEPFSILTAPYAIKDGESWKLWYVSGVGWRNPDAPSYHIKYADSEDGIHWNRKGTVSIDFDSPEEYALARPCVLKESGIYKMWYSYKGKAYRIGYAESVDGLQWTRMDQKAGIDVSDSGSDSEMIEYAFVLNHGGRKIMFYNGNEYGKFGVHVAVCAEAS
jgi:hypothetical protein